MHPTPAPEHARLAPLAGAWDVQMNVWTKPGEPSLKSRGFSVIEPLFGGLFLQERIEGLIGEEPFVTLTWFGFDPETRRYQTTRISSTRADRVQESGIFDEAQASLALESVAAPAGKSRSVLRFQGPDTWLVERFWVPASGESWRTAELRYTRRKA